MDLAEPFDSDRHFVDAATWQELNDMTRFLFNSGRYFLVFSDLHRSHFLTRRKNNDENLPYLPSSIRSMETTEQFTAAIGSGNPQAIRAFKQPKRTAR